MTGNSIISQPDVTVNIIPAQQKVSNTAQKVLIVGQMTTGTATAGDLQEQIGNASEENALFGETSMIAGMIRAFKSINEVTRIDAIGLADPVGDATGNIDFTGSTATEAGSLTVTLGSAANHTFTVPIADTDDATTIGASLLTALAGDTTLPVAGVNTAGDVEFTSVNAGSEANDITLKVEGSVAGVTVAMTAMSGGSLTPTLTGVFDVVGELRYQTVVWPFSYGLSDLTDFLDPRFNTTNDVQDGIGVSTLSDTFATISGVGTAQNSQSLIIIGFNNIDDTLFKGSSMLELGNVVSSEFAAIRSLRLTEGANISRFVISTAGGRDSFGGPALASLPYFNTPFPDLPLIPTGKGFERTEIEALLDAGVATIGNNKAGNETISGEVATTYKTDAAGNPDISFKFANFVDTASNVREYMFNNVKAAFAQSRLTEGDLIEGRSMANAASIGAFLVGLYSDLSEADFVLVQAGETAQNFFSNSLVIELDLSEGKVTVDMKVPLVTQFREFIATLQIAFSTEG